MLSLWENSTHLGSFNYKNKLLVMADKVTQLVETRSHYWCTLQCLVTFTFVSRMIWICLSQICPRETNISIEKSYKLDKTKTPKTRLLSR